MNEPNRYELIATIAPSEGGCDSECLIDVADQLTCNRHHVEVSAYAELESAVIDDVIHLGDGAPNKITPGALLGFIAVLPSGDIGVYCAASQSDLPRFPALQRNASLERALWGERPPI